MPVELTDSQVADIARMLKLRGQPVELHLTDTEIESLYNFMRANSTSGKYKLTSSHSSGIGVSVSVSTESAKADITDYASW